VKITRIEKWKVVVPIRPDAANSPEYDSKDAVLSSFWNVPKHVVRLHTDDSGIVGIGETGRGCPAEQVDAGIAALTGQELGRIDLQALPVPRNSAYGAFEMAVYDAVGRWHGVTAARLLGAQVRDRVAVDYWTARRTPADLARKAREGRERGFHGIKIKCALEDPNVERLQAVADAVGYDFKVTVDPNCRFHLPCHAVALADALGPLRRLVAVFEDPVPKDNLDWYLLLRQKLQVPVALHLGSGRQVFEAVKREAVDMLNISPGSMVEFVRQCYIAEQAGVPVWHGSGVDLGILDMSYVQACAAAPAATLPSDVVGNFLREDDLIVESIRIEGGYALVPERPGLGVELDEPAVRRYSVP
jgi:L-alanine-DL-glutamate epimerase-like enolase superfamily enzyme